MKSLFAKIQSVEFIRHIATLLFGTVLAQLIPVLASPLLTRLYSPDMFGIFSLFLSVSFILASFSTGKYELAIMLPKEKNKAFLLFVLSVLSSVVVNSIFFVALLFFSVDLAQFLDNPALSAYLYWCPLLAFFTAFYIAAQYLINREKHYQLMTRSKITQTFSATGFQLLTFTFLGIWGLILGQFLGQVLAIGTLMKKVLPSLKAHTIKVKRLKAVARQYRKFPLFFNFSYGLNTFVSNMTPIILASSFGVKYAGLYLVVQRALGVPVGVLVSSISSVFFQKATTQKDCRRLYLSISLGLFVAGLPVVALLYFYAPALFVFVFGEQWQEAGEMAALLGIMYCLSVATNPVSQFSTIHQKVFYNIAWQLALLGSILFAWYMGTQAQDIFVYLKIYVILQSLLYIVGYVYEYSLCVKQAREG